MKRDVEVLAPAGTYEILKAAIYAGADAVYVGGHQFGARAFAGNFSKEELLSAIDFVHLHGKKIYLTVNTLLKDAEMSLLYDYLCPLYERGLDAVIVQDMGVLSFVKAQFPQLSIHASTQMTVTNVLGASYLESLGVERVVPARELSLSEIQEIASGTQLEVECFVHGALCYGYSGQCLMSSLIGGRSGNRGQCAQPCRLPYQTDIKKPSKDFLSLKDLSAIDLIPELIASDITSFKIEGRMKGIDYVTTVVSLYRTYVDRYMEDSKAHFFVEKEDRRKLLKAYQRRGYLDGYYKRQNGREMLSLEQPNKIVNAEHPDMENTLSKLQEKIKGEFILIPEEHATLNVCYRGIEVSVTGETVQRANKQPLSEERVLAQLQKTGNTPFVFEEVKIEMTEAVFLPLQGINDIRRRALDLLEEKMLQPFQRSKVAELPGISLQTERKEIEKESTVHVLVENIEQLKVTKEYSFIERVYLEDSSVLKEKNLAKFGPIIEEVKKSGKKVYLAMARIFRTQAAEYYNCYFTKEARTLFDGMLIRNLESYVYLKKQQYEKPIITDANVYQWNQYAKQFWKQLQIDGMTAPVELNYKELGKLDIREMEYIIYGYQPVMISAGCVKNSTHQCDKKEELRFLTDRYKKTFMVKNDCNYCYNVIYNSVPLCLLEQKTEIRKRNPQALRFEFYQEDKAEMKELLDCFKRIWIGEMACKVPLPDYTKGHFKRGVK